MIWSAGMSKKTVSQLSVIDFFGFRLAIPFESSLTLCAAVTHALIYPQRSTSDELGVLSLQKILQYPDDFIDIVQDMEENGQSSEYALNSPFNFPLSLQELTSAPLNNITRSSPSSKKTGEYALNRTEAVPSKTTFKGKEHLRIESPFLWQLRRCFSPSNRKENQLKFLQWLKEILVLYEHKVGDTLTYVFYPYHPYLLKQVKRFGPIGTFFAEQFEQSATQMQRTRNALLQLLLSSEEESDYIESLIRPLLLHEYATKLAKTGWQRHYSQVKQRFVVVPYWPVTQEMCLYDISTSNIPRYLGHFELKNAANECDVKQIAKQAIATCFKLKSTDVVWIAVFTAGSTPLDDTLSYFHYTTYSDVRRLDEDNLLDLIVPPTQEALSLYQLELMPSKGEPGSVETVLQSHYMHIVMEDIEHIASLQGLDRFERLKWIDRLLNFHLVLYTLHRGVRDCNCYKTKPEVRETPTCNKLFAVVDCTREFRSDVAHLCYNDFAFLREGVRRNYREFIEWRLEHLGQKVPDVLAKKGVVEEYWKNTLKFSGREKTFDKFYQFLLDVNESLVQGKKPAPIEVWTEALLQYFNSSGGDLFRVFEVVNTHGRNIGFVEPTTGRSSRRKLTMTPDMLEVVIHCVAKPSQKSIDLSDFIDALYDRYGMIVNIGDARWHREFTHLEDKKRIEGWVSTLGEQNKSALRNMLREAGLLIEYSDSNAEVKVHYDHE